MTTETNQKTIIIVGATGDLGGRIARALVKRGAKVKALARRESGLDAIVHLRGAGVIVEKVDFDNISELAAVMQGASCVVSALSGLRKTMIDVQTMLLTAAVEAGVPRFIPSDFSLDFTKTPEGTNRNLDLRREFRKRLDAAPIAATSILNGMFADLLLGEAPLVLFPLNRIVYWGEADQPLDFTTIADTAEYTAAAALDDDTPRDLRVAGDTLTARGLQEAASQSTGKVFKLFRVGGLATLDFMIKATRTLMPAEDEVFPPWQGMQYLRNMLSGHGKLAPMDTHRYPEIRFTTVREVLDKKK